MSELKSTKGCICVLSLLIAFLLLTTLAALGLAVFRFLSVSSSPMQFCQPFSEEIVNSTELINKAITHIQNNVSNILAHLNNMQVTTLSLRNRVASLETQLDTADHNLILLKNLVASLETRLSDIDMQVNDLASLRSSVSSLEFHLNATDNEFSGLTSLRSSVTSLETQLNMTHIIISSLQNNIASQPSKDN